MKKTEINLLSICKKSIENKLNWGSSNEWTQRHFEKLIDLIEEKSNISLSLSTLKRIWRYDVNKLPHESTLNALAIFIEFEDWYDFINHYEKQSEGVVKKVNKRKKNSFIPVYLIISIILITLIVLTYFFVHKENDNINFRISKQYGTKAPCDVTYYYNIKNVDADKFAIQHTVNSFECTEIPISSDSIQFTYDRPGYFNSKLLADDSAIAEIPIYITTKEWEATLRYQNKSWKDHIYLNYDELKNNGNLSINQGYISKNRININQELYTTYYFIDSLGDLSGNNLIAEIKLKADSIYNYSQLISYFALNCESHWHFIPLISKDNERFATLKIGENRYEGNKTDLSNLTCNLYNWQILKLEIINKIAKVYINNKLVFETEYKKDIGQLRGLNVSGLGLFRIDYFRLYDIKNNLIYSNDF